MANYTKNLNLKKPLQTEFYNVDDFNENADIIDEKMGEAIDHHKDYSNPHKTTADGVKAPKMLTYGETKNFATVLDACNALKYGGGFVASNYTEMVNASDYPQKGYEFVFHVICEANEARKAVIAYGYHGSKINVFQRNIFNGAWETTWKSTDQAYLSLSGGTLSGGLKINGGIGSFGAIEQYLSLAHVDEDTPSDYRNFTVSNPSDIIDSLYLHEVREGKEVAAYRIFGEHNKHLMGVSFIGSVGSYTGTGLSNGKSTVILNFDFPVKILLFGRRDFVPKGTGEAGKESTENVYNFEHSSPINVEAMLLNEYNGKAITTKAQINPDNTTPTTLMISADRKTVTITADNAHVGFNEKGGYYFYTAIG